MGVDDGLFAGFAPDTPDISICFCLSVPLPLILPRYSSYLSECRSPLPDTIMFLAGGEG